MQNINIDSLGNFAGGEYGSVNIDGVASCQGDITCDSFSTDGTFHCSGSLTAKSASADGTLAVGGDMTAETFDIDGATSVLRDLHVRKLSTDGSLSVKGSIYTERFDLDGSASVLNDLNAQKVSVDGSLSVQGSTVTDTLEVDGSVKLTALRAKQFTCDGSAHITDAFYAEKVSVDGTMKTDCDLEAESIRIDGCITSASQISADRIEIYGSVQADEIVGDYIRIETQGYPYVHKLFNTLFKHFGHTDSTSDTVAEKCANLIEATTIELSGVTAGVVSGQNVTIGENCRIDRLDCTGQFTVDPSSTVRILNGQPYNA